MINYSTEKYFISALNTFLLNKKQLTVLINFFVWSLLFLVANMFIISLPTIPLGLISIARIIDSSDAPFMISDLKKVSEEKQLFDDKN